MKLPIRPGELSLRAALMDRCSGQGPKSDILQLSGQAQHTLRSTFINGILEAEAAYKRESVKKLIDATNDLVF